MIISDVFTKINSIVASSRKIKEDQFEFVYIYTSLFLFDRLLLTEEAFDSSIHITLGLNQCSNASSVVSKSHVP